MSFCILDFGIWIADSTDNAAPSIQNHQSKIQNLLGVAYGPWFLITTGPQETPFITAS